MRRLLAAPGFARLWVSAFFGETAEWMLQVALPVYLFVRTGSAVTTALSIVLGLLPAVLLSPVAGIVADRWDRRVVLAAVCAGQAVVVLPLLAGSELPVAAVYAVMAAQAGLASVFEPARSALVPELVGVEDVTPANGLMSVNGSVARLAGGWAGGALLGWGGLDRVVIGYLAALAVAGMLLAFPFRRVAVRETAPEQADWLAGIRDLAGKRLRATSVSALLTSLAQGMFLVLFVVFVLDILRGSEADAGLLRGVQAIGGLAAGFAVATLARRVAPVLLQGWGLVAAGLMSVAIWNLPGATTVLGVYVGLFMAVGAPAVVAGAGLLSHVQAETGPDRAGRVLSTVYALMAAGTAAGSLLAGALVAVIGPTVLLNVQASLHVSAGLVVLGWGNGRFRRSRARKVVTVDECRLSSPPATST
ncbi:MULTISPECIES: MFS transporter [Amycolatopsis]|uniref:MFS transporter n=1 Tax=Amycolatopsis dendrobii TaxID=2760662 RepID=A0A7W3ZEI5_9PSEU|nr:MULTISPECIES: MFS transporter [Amycolatopsis]MBB1157934.1 MFS transporter [Amycolatopsis dendrobii]UKD57264.1 MFS transporter [Amycolatopsis sp. FU40]